MTRKHIAIVTGGLQGMGLAIAAEIAALVAFCCSEAAAGLTMEDIQVNAGALW